MRALLRTVLSAALALTVLQAWAAPPESPSWTVLGDRANAHLGGTVASNGDVNGDGYDDVVAGAPLYEDNIGGGGRAFLYLGSPSGPSDQPAWSYVSNQASSRLGLSLSSAGDLNGDGSDDLAVGAPNYDGSSLDSGRVFVFYGSPSGLPSAPSAVIDGPHASAGLGGTLAAADVNDDGFGDLAVSVPGFKNGVVVEGRVFLYFGSASGVSGSPSAILKATSPTVRLGGTVAAAGDVNGDGIADLVVNNASTNPPSFNLYLGPMASGGAEILPSQTIAGSKIGPLLAGPGDLDGDGFDDVLVGAPALVHSGSVAGLSSNPSWEENGVGTQVLAPGGDIDGDGHRDLIIGAPNFDNGTGSRGRALVFFGTGQGPALSSWWAAKGGIGTAFASAVSGDGDINGDGRPDIVVGQQTLDGAYFGQGAVFAYFGFALEGPDTQAGSDQVLECTGNRRADAALSGSAGPGPITTFEWFELFGTPSQTLVGSGDSIVVPFLLGQHVLTLRATDGDGDQGFDDFRVTVRDTLPPVLSAIPSRSMIWPPNHRQVPVVMSVQASDACMLQSWSNLSTASSEPDDAPGLTDGATTGDVVVAGQPLIYYPRAERDDMGSGRAYTMTIRATDSVGLRTDVSFNVEVPHEVDGVSEPMILRLEETPGGTVVRWSAVPGAINYNVIRGNVASLRDQTGYVELGPISCLAADLLATDTSATPDAALPAPGAAFYYLAEYDDGTSGPFDQAGRVSYGEMSAPKPRRSTTFPPSDCP